MNDNDKALLQGLYWQYRDSELRYRHDAKGFRAGSDTQVYLSAMAEYWAGMCTIVTRVMSEHKGLWRNYPPPHRGWGPMVSYTDIIQGN